MTSIQAAKTTLRKEIKNKLLILSAEERTKQSQNVFKKLLNHPVFKASKHVSVYLSTENEISTEPIIRTIFQNGKTCFVPRYNKDRMEMVQLYSMQDWEDLPLTKWKIKQPKLTEERENALNTGLDLLIVPGVAFTSTGLRLGHGKGYYDTYLSHLKKRQRRPPTTIALAFNEQILMDVPIHDHDVKIDYVLCPDTL